ncbi:helix-turn-helix transcriptional regulator [Saccharopolyspora sp. ASAGF58]|uniref:helix-turn-helix domain-containing protein n=1 Tax=Saccharopolyspora TaxID=1835 RepID=UPI00143FDF49|nr:helix-turn-helix transcriptional regulator [Saccharopolyspora sp. ASAGF58]QIZ36611.1 helix-turn-helix domain-containing protein [Saccharopolyspora sp. ASAGF58]
MPQSRATIERRQLGAELRRLREAASKSQKEAAQVIECDTSLISRLERGQRSLKVMELNALLHFYDAPKDSRDRIAEIAQLARQRLPRRTYTDSLPGAFHRLLDLEQDAAELHFSETDLIPGMLQTEGHIRALMRNGRAAMFESPPDDIEARVQFRLRRQELIQRNAPPEMWFVIGEAALGRPLGNRRVHHAQLTHLLDVIEAHDHVVGQVAPLSIVDHPLLGGSIEILRFGDDVRDIVYQGTLIGGGVYSDDETDIALASRAFDRLRAVALGPRQSADLIAEYARELKT